MCYEHVVNHGNRIELSVSPELINGTKTQYASSL